MAGDAAEPGRCGARTKAGGYCRRYPLAGKRRCRMHGGTQEGERAPSFVHGRNSPRMKRISAEAQREIDDAMQDPDLLDVRHGIALARVVMGDAMLIPDDSVIEGMARLTIARSLSNVTISSAAAYRTITTPTEADLEIARMAYLERSMVMIERFSRRQVDALKQVEVGRLMRESVLPLLQEMGLHLGRLIDKYVADENKEKFRDAFRAECHQILADLAQLREASS